MTDFTDLLDWAQESYPLEQYDSLAEWLNDIKSDFDNQGHHFPPEVVNDLEQKWNSVKGVESEPTEPLREDEIGIFDNPDLVEAENERRRQNAIRQAGEIRITQEKVFVPELRRGAPIRPPESREEREILQEPIIEQARSTAQAIEDRIIEPLPQRKENIVRRFFRRLFNR